MDDRTRLMKPAQQQYRKKIPGEAVAPKETP